MKSLMSWTCTTIKYGLLLVLITFSACQPLPRLSPPQLVYTPSNDEHSRFKTLVGKVDLNKDWGKEYKIGISLARERDYYRAITALKRALVLMPIHSIAKKNIYYNIGLCYFFGKKYEDALTYLEQVKTNSSWEYYSDYLTIIYDCYLKSHQYEKAELILDKLSKENPALENKLSSYTHLTKGDLKALKESKDLSLSSFVNGVEDRWKSPRKAQFLNAILPGSGYLYLNQKSTALTSFLLNSIFIATTYRLFNRHHVALGILAGSLELGWYIGGIHGAAESARFHNRLIYDREASFLMKKKRLFPALMIHYAF